MSRAAVSNKGFRVSLLVLFLFFLASPAFPAVQIVANGDDSGAGSLRQVLDDAAPGDIVEIPSSVTVVLASSLDITKDITIRGGGAVTGDVSTNSGEYLVKVDAARVAFERLSLRNMSAVLTPLYIVSGASVNFRNCVVEDNVAIGNPNTNVDKQAYGGAVSISGGAKAVFVGCTLSFNENERGRGGGAAYVAQGGRSYFVHCRFAGNRTYGAGGAIYAYDASSASLLGCTFEGNAAGTGGGSIYIHQNSDLRLVNCTFSGNASGWRGNTGAGAGGALAVHEDSRANLTNCTFSGNTVDNGATYSEGGAINTEPGSTLVLANCTLLGNWAGRWAGGIKVDDASTVTLLGSILAGNTAPSHPESNNMRILGDVASSGYNLLTGGVAIDTGGSATWAASGFASDNLAVPDATSVFGANTLADNGGFVPTVMIADDNRFAYDRIPAGQTAAFDARGVLRPNAPASQAAIGAVEYGPMPLPSSIAIVGPSEIILGESGLYRVVLSPDIYRGLELWSFGDTSTATALLSGDVTATDGSCTVEPLSAGLLVVDVTARVAGTVLSASTTVTVSEPPSPEPVHVLSLRPLSVDAGTETAYAIRFSRGVSAASVSIMDGGSLLEALPVAIASPDATAGGFRATLPAPGLYTFAFDTVDLTGSRDLDARIVEARDGTVVVPSLVSLTPVETSADVETAYAATFNTPLRSASLRIEYPDGGSKSMDLPLSPDGLVSNFSATLPEAGSYIFAFAMNDGTTSANSDREIAASEAPTPPQPPVTKKSSGGCEAAGGGLAALALCAAYMSGKRRP